MDSSLYIGKAYFYGNWPFDYRRTGDQIHDAKKASKPKPLSGMAGSTRVIGRRIAGRKQPCGAARHNLSYQIPPMITARAELPSQ